MRRLGQAAAGIAISAVALWLTLRGKDLAAIWRAVLSADYRYLAPYFLILAAIHLVRTVRWGILLEPVARIPFAKLNAASAVGFMALVLLPLRLGELARPYLVAERPRLRVSAALSSVVVERVADGIFTALLLVLTLVAVPEGTPGLHFLRATGVAVFLAFAALLGFLLLAHRNRARAIRLTHRLLGPLSPRLAERTAGMMGAFIHGLRLVPSRAKVALFFALTAGYWAMNGYGLKLLALGFGLDLSWVAAYTVLGVLVVGVMIPAGPGMVGTFQGAVVLALSLFAPRQAVDVHGTAYANVLWGAQVAQQTAFGLTFLFSRHIQLGRLARAAEEIEGGLAAEESEYRQGEGGPEHAGDGV